MEYESMDYLLPGIAHLVETVKECCDGEGASFHEVGGAVRGQCCVGAAVWGEDY